MKQIITLFSIKLLCFSVTAGNAQLSQNFDVNGSFTTNCWDVEGFSMTTDPSQIINGTGSLYSNPPVNNNGSGTRDVYTPYLNITSATLSVSFKYKLSSDLQGHSTRQLEVGLMGRDGIYTSLDLVHMDKHTPNLTQTNTYARTFTLTASSIKRLVLKFGGDLGSGQSRLIVDDLLTNANAHYNPSHCNGAPAASDNNYSGLSNTAPYIGTSVLNNDSDPNNEALTATLATASPDGTVVMNANGTFTFTPNATFTGAFTSFTYTVTDDGYSRLSSTATVSLYFAQLTTLPIQLLHFSGTADAKTKLNWHVAANETGLLFEVQRSTGGVSFQPIATLFATERSGEEQYGFTDAAPGQTTRYRLKIVNRDGTLFFSHIVSFQSGPVAGNLTLLQNPVQDNVLRFRLPGAVAAASRITIYNTAGAVVQNENRTLEKGTNQISLSLQQHLPAGTYILHAATGTNIKTTTFIKK